MKIIFADFDNTIYFGNDKDYAPLQKAVKAWQDAGNMFVIASGRSGPDLFPIYGALGITPDGFACAYGTMQYDRNKNLFAFRQSSNDTLKDFCALMDEYDYKYVAFTCDTGFHRFETPRLELKNLERFGKMYNGCAGFKNDEDTADFIQRAKARLGDRLNVIHQSWYFDLPPAGCNKATGVMDFASHYGVTRENIITVGDWLNDYDMIKEFRGITLHHAHPDIKAIATAEYADMPEIIYNLLTE